MPRVLAFVMDSAGVGALPDAASFGDAPKANTIGNVAERVGGLHMPNFERLGLGRTTTIRGGCCGRSAGRCGGPVAREITWQRHNHGALGNGWDRDGDSVPHLSRGLSERGRRRIYRHHRQAAARETSRLPARKSSPRWARSISGPAARFSIRRPIRCSKSRVTKTRCRSRPSTTGARRRGHAGAPA